MKIARTAALAIFSGLGMASADKWNAKRMSAKLAKVDEMVDANTKLEDKAADKNLGLVLKAIAAQEEIEVTDDAAPAPAPEAKAAKKTAAPVVPPAEGAVDMKGKKATKAPAAPKEPKAPSIPGVRETKTRPYLAGVIIAKHGMDAGITEAMAAELDTAYGKKNPTESLFCLRNAWHAVRGHADQSKENRKAAK